MTGFFAVAESVGRQAGTHSAVGVRRGPGRRTRVPLTWSLSAASCSRSRSWTADPANDPLFSAASVWEFAIKRSIGKLTAPDDLPDRISDAGFAWLHITCQAGFAWLHITAGHAWQVSSLPGYHRDPFDCMLVAQALNDRLPIITADTRFRDYGVEVRW